MKCEWQKETDNGAMGSVPAPSPETKAVRIVIAMTVIVTMLGAHRSRASSYRSQSTFRGGRVSPYRPRRREIS